MVENRKRGKVECGQVVKSPEEYKDVFFFFFFYGRVLMDEISIKKTYCKVIGSRESLLPNRNF